MSDMASKVYDEGYRAGLQKMVANAESNQIRMSEAQEAAAMLLGRNLEILKQVSTERERFNLKQQVEECQALLLIITSQKYTKKAAQLEAALREIAEIAEVSEGPAARFYGTLARQALKERNDEN
tara:strand:+ start:903 stop:1277 length:375 start_codon:yes stop_codon:yes gene_type:complete